MNNSINNLEFKPKDILKADDMNVIVDAVKSNQLQGAYDVSLSKSNNGQIARPKVQPVVGDSSTGAGISPKSHSTSTIENSSSGLKLYNASKVGLTNVSPYILEALTTGALPRNFMSLPVLQNCPVVDEILPDDGSVNTDLIALNDYARDSLYGTTSETSKPEYLESVFASTNADKNNALLYSLATSFLQNDEKLKDFRAEYFKDLVSNTSSDTTNTSAITPLSDLSGFDLALSSNARILNYMSMADVLNLTLPDSISHGQLAPYQKATSRSIGSMLIPVNGMANADYITDTTNYLSNDIRTGAQLYGFVVQRDGVKTGVSSENESTESNGVKEEDYFYPYFNADTFNGLSPINFYENGASDKLLAKSAAETYVNNLSSLVEHGRHPTTPGELALGLKYGFDIVIRVHTPPKAESIMTDAQSLLSAYPDLSSTINTLSAAEGLRTPMVSYIPGNMLFSEVTGTFPVLEDVFWDVESHSLKKTFRYWDVQNGRITSIRGSGVLSSINTVDSTGELVEKTIELPLSALIAQGVPEQI